MHQNRIIFMGTPEFAVGSLKALIDGGYNVVGVVTVPDKPSGRGQKINISAVKEYALTLNIPILQPVSLKEPSFIDALTELKADIFVVVAFRMLPKIVWSMPKLGTFNLHASLLPNYRGAAPINWAIINGEKETGVTTFLLDEKIDTGHIIFQEKCPILDEDNIGSLYDKLMEIGSPLVLKTIDALVSGDYQSRKQDENSTMNPAPKITRQTCELDWSQNAQTVLNLIRGLSPYPAPHSMLQSTAEDGSQNCVDVKIYKAEYCASAISTASPKTPGTIICDGKKELYVACGSGFLKILELQIAGKKRLAIRDFLAGWREGFKNTIFTRNVNI